MEKRDSLEKIWKQGRSNIEKQEIPVEENFRKTTGKRLNLNKIVIEVYLAIYLLMLLVTAVLEIMNLNVYKGNPVMIAVHSGVLTISLTFIGYGIRLWVKIRRIQHPGQDLASMIRNQIRFYKIDYEVWIWMISLTAVLASFAINTLIDNDNGTYRINNPYLFTGIMVGMIVFLYVMIKLAHYPLLKELRIRLSDLSAQTTESTDRFEKARKKWRPFAIAMLIVITVLLGYVLILGIVRYGIGS